MENRQKWERGSERVREDEEEGVAVGKREGWGGCQTNNVRSVTKEHVQIIGAYISILFASAEP